MSLRRVAAAALLVLPAACGNADAPATYHGHAGAVRLAIPSRVASSVLYDGESDWTPPEQPKAARTDRDAISEVEFFVDLDHPDSIVAEADARAALLARGGVVHHPDVFGHVLGVTALLGGSGFLRDGIAATRRGYMAMPAFKAMRQGPAIAGLSARYANYGVKVPGREPHGLEMTDAQFTDLASETEIHCNDARMVVAPFAPMPTCHIWVVDRRLGASLMTDFDRGDLPRWRDLRRAMLATLASFEVKVPAAEPSRSP